MNKENIISVLREMADLLEITEANAFEIRGVRNAAQGLDDWTGDFESAVNSATLTEIDAVGKKTAAIISDLAREDWSAEVDRVRALVPEKLPGLLRFRGLGPKRVRTLWQQLGIESPDDLKRAADEGQVQALKGFGPKTVEKILSSIEYFEDRPPPSSVRTDLSDDVIRPSRDSSGAIWAGTSGYSYPQWKGSFYPDEIRTDDLLKFYASQLGTVEINNTFYRFPSSDVVESWKSRTGDDFQFSLKAHRQVTHQKRLAASATRNIVEFVQRASELGHRRGCILYQLPPDFQRDDQRLEHLLANLPPGPRYAVEFRHESWFDETVFEKLRNQNVACVSGDGEDDPQRQHVTADFIYVRLRRPNYSPDELDSWNDWFQSLQAENRDLLVYLKHDESGAVPCSIRDRWPA